MTAWCGRRRPTVCQVPPGEATSGGGWRRVATPASRGTGAQGGTAQAQKDQAGPEQGTVWAVTRRSCYYCCGGGDGGVGGGGGWVLSSEAGQRGWWRCSDIREGRGCRCRQCGTKDAGRLSFDISLICCALASRRLLGRGRETSHPQMRQPMAAPGNTDGLGASLAGRQTRDPDIQGPKERKRVSAGARQRSAAPILVWRMLRFEDSGGGGPRDDGIYDTTCIAARWIYQRRPRTRGKARKREREF